MRPTSGCSGCNMAMPEHQKAGVIAGIIGVVSLCNFNAMATRAASLQLVQRQASDCSAHLELASLLTICTSRTAPVDEAVTTGAAHKQPRRRGLVSIDVDWSISLVKCMTQARLSAACSTCRMFHIEAGRDAGHHRLASLKFAELEAPHIDKFIKGQALSGRRKCCGTSHTAFRLVIASMRVSWCFLTASRLFSSDPE